MINLKDKRITVTGGAGFLGTHLLAQLRVDNKLKWLRV
jgi:nucleoside-diphosphate-sugar epimerase